MDVAADSRELLDFAPPAGLPLFENTERPEREVIADDEPQP